MDIKERYQQRVEQLTRWIGELQTKLESTSGTINRIDIEDRIYKYQTELLAKQTYIDSWTRDQEQSMGITTEQVKECEENRDEVMDKLKKKLFKDEGFKQAKIGILNRYNQDKYEHPLRKVHDFKEAKRLLEQ